MSSDVYAFAAIAISGLSLANSFIAPRIVRAKAIRDKTANDQFKQVECLQNMFRTKLDCIDKGITFGDEPQLSIYQSKLTEFDRLQRRTVATQRYISDFQKYATHCVYAIDAIDSDSPEALRDVCINVLSRIDALYDQAHD